MITSQFYIIIAIVALAVIAIIVFFINPAKKSARLSPLSAWSFAFVVAGTFFGERAWLGYGLMGTGIVIAIVDIIRKYRRSKSME